MAILYIYLSVGVRGGQHNHYALINQVIPPCDIMSEAHITASVQLTECMMRVWREDWCQHWTTICVTLPLLNHTNWCSVSVSPSSQTCQQTQRNPPPSSPPSWALPILCVSAWLNGGHISRLHSLWHCMGVNAGRVFLSDSCTLSNPWQQHFLTVLDDHYFGAQFFLWHSCFGYTCASVALYPGYALSSHSQH